MCARQRDAINLIAKKRRFSARAIRETGRVVLMRVELIMMMVEGMGGVMRGGSL